MNLSNKLLLPLSFFLLVSCGGDNYTSDINDNTPIPIVSASFTATYELTFTNSWSNNTFPTNYPDNAHFSPLVGLTHNEKTSIFKRDTNASPGIISMAETGSKELLKGEIAVIQNLGDSGNLIDELGIPVNETSVTITFEASQDFSLLSIVSMVAPSPDWFVGINSLVLFENNQWVDDITVQLAVYDAGSDSGEVFKSENIITTPLEVIKRLSTNRADTDFEEGVHFETEGYIGVIQLKWIE